MGRPKKNLRAKATPRRLLDAALSEFARVGYRAARLEDVARRAGIRRPSLLYHFSTKRFLYRAVVQRVFCRLGQDLKAAGALGKMDVESLARAFSGFVDTHPEWAALLLREFLDGDAYGRRLFEEEITPLLEEFEALLRPSSSAERAGLSARGGLLSLASTLLLAAASGRMKEALWKGEQPAVSLARVLLKEA